MKILLFAGMLILGCSVATFSQPASTREMPPDFKTDRCTFFPEGNYCECCVEHDKDYYFGGSEKERWRSDKRLYKCIKAKKGWQNKVVAPMMWLGVRVGGASFLPTPFRWGFGKTKRPKIESPTVIPIVQIDQ